MLRLTFVVTLMSLSTLTLACPHHRNREARAEFQRTHHRPATGKARGACVGYVVDHVIPLCADGKDKPTNMQWQTTADARVKDAIERKQCRRPK